MHAGRGHHVPNKQRGPSSRVTLLTGVLYRRVDKNWRTHKMCSKALDRAGLVSRVPIQYRPSHGYRQQVQTLPTLPNMTQVLSSSMPCHGLYNMRCVRGGHLTTTHVSALEPQLHAQRGLAQVHTAKVQPTPSPNTGGW